MPYSITTKDGISINNIPDDVPADSQSLKDRVASIRAGNGAKALDPAERTGAQEAGRAIGLTARHGLEGVAAGAGMITDPIIMAIGGAVRAATGKEYDPATLASVGTMVSDALGLPKPETSNERMVGALTRGVAGGLGGARSAAGIAATTSGTTQRVAQTMAAQPAIQAASGGAAGLAGQLVAENGGGSGAQLAAALAGGVGGGIAAGATSRAVSAARTTPVVPEATVTPLPADELAATARQASEKGILTGKSATRVLAEQAMPDQKAINAAKRLGIAEHLQPDHVTTNQAYRELAQAIKSTPGSTTRAVELEGLEAVAKRADDLVSEFGGSRDLSTLDSRVKGRMQATQTELSDKADDLYAQLRARIPAKAEAPAPNVLAFITKRADELDGEANLSGLERTILRKLRPREATDDTGATTVKQPTYALLDDVRRDLTAARVKRQGPFKDADTGLIKRLEGALKSDQAAAIEPYGANDLFKSAQAVVAVRKGLEDDMTALFSKELSGSMLGQLGTAMASLPKGDVSKFVKLVQAVPEGMRQETVASGLSSAFNISAKNQKLSFSNYANWYEGLLKNRQAHAALFANLPPAARKQMSDLYRVSRGISKATRERITTGRILAVENELRGPDTLMSNIYGVAKRASVGVAAEAVTSSVGLPGAGLSAGLASALTRGKPDTVKAADALISSPEFLEALRAVAAGEQRRSARILAASRAFKEFKRSVRDPLLISDPEQWIMRSLNTAVVDKARQDQPSSASK